MSSLDTVLTPARGNSIAVLSPSGNAPVSALLGLAQVSDLSDIATADLPAVNAPLSSALAGKVGSSTITMMTEITRTAYNALNTIPTGVVFFIDEEN